MLRDMEDLLNKVKNDDIKKYLAESIRCYNAGSYRASVIMSVIAGVYDLHGKVKSLASTDKAFRDLDEQVEKYKSSFSPFEKFLFEQCATPEIDMISNSELKELIRCLDTRNDCAHPSDFYCSPEKARDVYSSIIDILASKPVLQGFKQIGIIIDQLKNTTFFPSVILDKTQSRVYEILSKLQPKAIPSLINKICELIKKSNNPTELSNAIYFFASINDDYEDIFKDQLDELISNDDYEDQLMSIISYNYTILNKLSDLNIEKVIKKLEINLHALKNNNLDVWVNIITSPRIQQSKYIEDVANTITSYSKYNIFTGGNSNIDTKYELVYKVLLFKECTPSFRELLISKSNKQFTIHHYSDSYLMDIIRISDSKTLYDNCLNTITNSILSYNFKSSNTAINVFYSMTNDNKVWAQLTDYNLKIRFLENIVDEGTSENPYYSHECRNISYDLNNKYPYLSTMFVGHVLKNKIEKYLTNTRYIVLLTQYIVADKDSIENNLLILNQLKLEGLNVDELIRTINLQLVPTT